MADIKTNDQFEQELEKCIKHMSGFDASYKDRMFNSIEMQLNYLQDWSNKGFNLHDPKLLDLNFGLLAGKTFDDIDPKLCEDLIDLANYVDDMLPAVD